MSTNSFAKIFSAKNSVISQLFTLVGGQRFSLLKSHKNPSKKSIGEIFRRREIFSQFKGE